MNQLLSRHAIVITALVAFVAVLPNMVAGFGMMIVPGPTRTTTTTASTTRLFGWFDFKTFHGHGSGESQDELDEQWQIQQEILAARRGSGLDKAHLKQKYAGGAKGDLSFLGSSSGGGGRGSSAKGQRSHVDSMWIEDNSAKQRKKSRTVKQKKTSVASAKTSASKPKFFWDK